MGARWKGEGQSRMHVSHAVHEFVIEHCNGRSVWGVRRLAREVFPRERYFPCRSSFGYFTQAWREPVRKGMPSVFHDDQVAAFVRAALAERRTIRAIALAVEAAFPPMPPNIAELPALHSTQKADPAGAAPSIEELLRRPRDEEQPYRIRCSQCAACQSRPRKGPDP